MSGTLRGKKPKETPKNLQWNNFQKNLAVAQTSFLQYFGKRESKQVPKEFSVANAKVKKLRENFDELVKASKYYIKASQGYSASNTSFVESLQTLSTTIGETHNLSPVLLKVAELETKIETSYAKMRDDLGRLVLFVEKFSNEKIDPARESYKSWNRSRLEYDAAKDRLDPLKNASHLSPINLLVAQTNYYHARVKEMTRYLNASDKMGAVLWERDFEFLQELINWMEIMHGILLTQYSLLYDQEQLTSALTETSNQRRTTYYTAKDEKARLKREKDIEAYRNRYQPIIALLSAEDLALVNALCVTAASEQEQTLESLVRILDAMKQTLPIIKLGITKEVSKTTTEATLFRGNTTATKLMTAFTKMTGREYLNRSLKDVMSEAIADVQKNGDKIEVDPSKMTNKDEAARQQSLDNLKNIVAKFLNAILASIDICPVPFRVMANHLQAEVVKRFPDSKYQSVAGFIFLRFFCPAILAPDTNGLYSGSLNEKERRLLILVSKVLQNIANGVDFGNKEPYMQDLNSFIHENVPQVHKFFDKLVTVPENIDDYEPLCSFQNAVSVELPSLHKKITSNLDKIGKCLIQYKQAECISPLAVILAELDEAVDPSLTPFIPPSALSAYNAGNNSKRETKDKEKDK